MKTCTKCGLSKSLDAFQKAPGYRDGLKTHCKECVRAYRSAHQAANIEAVRLRDALYRITNASKVSASKRAYKLSPKGLAQKDQPQQRVNDIRRAADWARENPIKAKANRMNRYARTKGATGRITAEDLAALWIGNDGKCAYCPAVATEFDHVIPFARGGEHSAENLLPCCESCNASKQEFELFDWLARRAERQAAA